MSARRKNRFEQELFDFAQTCEERKKGVDELFATVGDYVKPRRFLRLLEQMAQFDDYAPYNALLIVLQRPRARYVFTPKRWRELHRTIRREARPIVVLRPFAPVMYLFEASDTRVRSDRVDGFPSVERRHPPLRSDPLDPVPGGLVRRLESNLPFWGVARAALPSGPSASGTLETADLSDGDFAVPVGGEEIFCRPAYVLRARTDVPPTDLFAALVSALAHLFCRHLRCAYEKGWGNGRNLKPETESFEARVVTWLVSRRRRVASPAYQALKADLEGLSELPPFSFDTVLDAVTEIERLLGDCMARDGYLFRYSPSFAERVRSVRTSAP